MKISTQLKSLSINLINFELNPWLLIQNGLLLLRSRHLVQVYSMKINNNSSIQKTSKTCEVEKNLSEKTSSSMKKINTETTQWWKKTRAQRTNNKTTCLKITTESRQTPTPTRTCWARVRAVRFKTTIWSFQRRIRRLLTFLKSMRRILSSRGRRRMKMSWNWNSCRRINALWPMRCSHIMGNKFRCRSFRRDGLLGRMELMRWVARLLELLLMEIQRLCKQ